MVGRWVGQTRSGADGGAVVEQMQRAGESHLDRLGLEEELGY